MDEPLGRRHELVEILVALEEVLPRDDHLAVLDPDLEAEALLSREQLPDRAREQRLDRALVRVLADGRDPVIAQAEVVERAASLPIRSRVRVSLGPARDVQAAYRGEMRHARAGARVGDLEVELAGSAEQQRDRGDLFDHGSGPSGAVPAGQPLAPVEEPGASSS